MARKIGALWLKTSKDGKKYMSGVLEDLRGDIRIAVFKNDKKEKDNHPDYQIILSEDRKDEPKNDGFTQPPANPAAAEGIDFSDIPF